MCCKKWLRRRSGVTGGGNFWRLIGKNEARKGKQMGNDEENEEKWKKEGWKLGKIEKKNNKKGRRKMRNVRWKKLRTFFFLCFSLLINQWTFFCLYQNGNFHREKAKIAPGKNRVKRLHARKKSGTFSLPPKKNFPVTPLGRRGLWWQYYWNLYYLAIVFHQNVPLTIYTGGLWAYFFPGLFP